MRSPHRASLLAGILVLCNAFAAQAGIAWDEAIQDDFSNNGLVPTAVTMSVGTNSILGTTGNAGQGIDRDYFVFTVPAGAALSALVVTDSTTVSGGASFLGMQAGAQVTTSSDPNVLLGFAHYSNDHIGTDILPLITSSVPLPAGTYAVWVQETGGPVSYGFDFVLSGAATAHQVPAAPPLALLALLAVLTSFGRRSWREKKRRLGSAA